MARTTREVIETHLKLWLAGNLDDDLRGNYSEDVLLLTAEGVNGGHDAVPGRGWSTQEVCSGGGL